MTIEQFVNMFRQTFYANLNQKTNWGRNQIREEFERSLSQAMMRVNSEGQGHGHGSGKQLLHD